jgi:hypothetical protein
MLCALISHRDQNLLKISRISRPDDSERNISVYQWPHRGGGGRAIFRPAISVPLLKLLYVCPVVRSNLVLFIFHSDGRAVFLFLFFGFLFYFSVVKSIKWGSFSADTLTSNEVLLLSEVSE